MTKPLSTTMWCPAVKVGTRWKLSILFARSTRQECKQDFELAFKAFDATQPPTKYVKVRIQEVQGAGFLVSKGGKK